MDKLEKAVVLLSGGLDSTTLLHHVKKSLEANEVYALSLIYGQKHARELEMATWQAEAVGVKEHRLIDISFVGELLQGGSALTNASIPVPNLADLAENQLSQPPTYVPNRNMILLSLACAWAESVGARSVFYGAQAQDQYGYWDCTVDFVTRINDVLALNRQTCVTIEAPFADYSKAELLKIGLGLGVDYAHTWSCYRGKEQPCGACPTCVERMRAFEAVGLLDPLDRE
ncbi:MAG: 7-cyano-7-deazaguanine synthase QueC [Verrucomicrobia bacterium]|jgi:7-cyano-7-deazaguanine synthase|nr:7-cyano-7-deazaguanine synthase QueC [Verrucomicrobiota bacterium]